jgi:hypothetical protein
MGWYTELKIGDRYWSWRKSLPVEVPLLFYGKHKIVQDKTEVLTFESDVFVGYEASVGQVISNLDALGLTIDFFKSTYGSYRKDLISWGLAHLKGIKGYYEYSKDEEKVTKSKIKEVNQWIDRIENGSPNKDIDCVVQLLKGGIILESSLLDDESLIPSLTNVRMDVNLNDPNVLEATTFGIFLSYAHDILPEIAWLYEVRIILETLSKRSKVKLNLKEWVMEGGNLEIIEGSLESLALKAKTYGRTFDAILGGNETYNKEFERIQLTEKWTKLKGLQKDHLSKGTKLEEFIACLFHKSFGFEVIAKKLLVETQELDIVLKNISKNDFIKSLNSPFILIECKNWTSPVGVSEARVFESKYRESGKKVDLGIFVAVNGVTKPFKTHLNNLVRDGINLIVIDDKAIESYLYSEALDVGVWLEKTITEQFILK